MGLDTRESETLGEKCPPWQASPADDGQPMETDWPMIDVRVWDRLVCDACSFQPQTGQAVFPHPAFGQGCTDNLLHTFAHEQSPLGSLKLIQAQLLVQVFIVKPLLSVALYLELRAQPLADPMADMAVDGPVGFAHRPDAKVVGPSP